MCGTRGRVGLLVVEEHAVLDREVALGDPVALELLVDHPAHLVDADLVDQHLQAGAGAVDAQPVLAVEDAQDGLGPHQVGAVVGRDELVQGRSDARHDRRAAADAELEALHAVALARDERDVVDAGQRAVGAAAAVEGGLDLARHQLRRGVAHEVAHERARVGRRVEELVGADAGPRVGGHVAHRVAAALAAGEAGLGELADVGGGVAQRDVVDLDVLPRRDVALLERHELLDRARERVHLLGRDAAPRELDPDHLHVGLALPVDPLLEPEADELVLGRAPGEVLLGLVVEVVELAPDDRDDVARHVLADLGIRERPLPAGRGRRLHQPKVAKADWLIEVFIGRRGANATPRARGRSPGMRRTLLCALFALALAASGAGRRADRLARRPDAGRRLRGAARVERAGGRHGALPADDARGTRAGGRAARAVRRRPRAGRRRRLLARRAAVPLRLHAPGRSGRSASAGGCRRCGATGSRSCAAAACWSGAPARSARCAAAAARTSRSTCAAGGSPSCARAAAATAPSTSCWPGAAAARRGSSTARPAGC